MSALIGYLDYILLPALAILFILTIVSYRRYRKSQQKKGEIMSDCCNFNQDINQVNQTSICPKNGNKGNIVSTITLKSLLLPEALASLNPNTTYRFCNSPDCDVVYFSDNKKIFTKKDLKVSVFQKDNKETVPVCYCFGWTRQRINNDLKTLGKTHAVEEITSHVQAKRCACEVNNPQGSCCLANVKSVIKSLENT